MARPKKEVPFSLTCPRCKADHTHIFRGGTYTVSDGTTRKRWKCKKCGRKWVDPSSVRSLTFESGKSSYEETGNSATATGVVVSEKELTAEEVLQRFFKDLNINSEEWEVTEKRIGKWSTSSKYREQDLEWTKGKGPKGEDTQIMEGHSIRKNEWVKTWNYKVAIVMKKKHPFNLEKQKDAFLTELKQYQPSTFIVSPSVDSDANLFVVFLNDLHLGRLAWAPEVGRHYDHKIAQKNYNLGFGQSLTYASPFKKKQILFVLNGDIFNYDYWFETPKTQAGTPQSSDERWQKLFRIGYSLVVKSIDTLMSIAPTKVIVIGGNHDRQTTFYLGELLEIHYKLAKDVEIDNTPKFRKYHTFGNTVLGFAHGQKEKPSDLFSIMFADYGHEMGKSRYQYFYLGHKHHEIQEKRETKPRNNVRNLETQVQRSEDYKGLFIHYLPNLAFRDHFEYNHGYVGTIRSMVSAIHHEKDGRIATFNYNMGA